MNFKGIESDIITYLGEGYDTFDSLDRTGQLYLAGMVASDQDMKMQLEIMNESICDNAEFPGNLFTSMLGAGFSSAQKSLRFASMIESDVLRYMTKELSEEYTRVHDMYFSKEEIELRVADLEKVL